MSKREIDDLYEEESASKKFIRRSKENPVVPVGICAALGCCGYAAYNFKNRGNTKISVYLIQLRVIAQGMVVGAMALTAISQLYQRHQRNKKN